LQRLDGATRRVFGAFSPCDSRFTDAVPARESQYIPTDALAEAAEGYDGPRRVFLSESGLWGLISDEDFTGSCAREMLDDFPKVGAA
jgi:hypothetical protein